ncbi:MAG TPA: hypothetical protein ENL22_01020 [candidate division Zixibacteria bacterium]|nr:hypothetical protein [candidate division Zixibacteria bacterium]
MDRQKIRWIIFTGLFVIVALAYTVEIKMVSQPSFEVKKSFDYIESLPEGTILMVSFDHEASSLPEVQPISLVLIRHAFRNNLKIIGLSLFAEGTAIGYRTLNRIAAEYDKRYGYDYVFLGFKPQHIAAILGMGESIYDVFPRDYLGHLTDTIPIMDSVENYDDIEMVISITDGDRAVQWIEYAGPRYNQKIMAGLTAAMITSYDPYLSSGQLSSVIGGLKGAAEYENLYGEPGKGNRGMPAQTAAHLYLVVLIVIGNIIYFRNRKRQGRGGL